MSRLDAWVTATDHKLGAMVRRWNIRYRARAIARLRQRYSYLIGNASDDVLERCIFGNNLKEYETDERTD